MRNKWATDSTEPRRTRGTEGPRFESWRARFEKLLNAGILYRGARPPGAEKSEPTPWLGLCQGPVSAVTVLVVVTVLVTVLGRAVTVLTVLSRTPGPLTVLVLLTTRLGELTVTVPVMPLASWSRIGQYQV